MVRSTSDRSKVYKYVHTENVYIVTNITGRSFENDFLSIETNGRITVKGKNKKGYAWDGCSPKSNFLHFIWGTPDGSLDYRTEKPITYYASMIHDVLYQYKTEIEISRKDADILFRQILKESKFMWWWVYGAAVRMGGGFYGKWKVKGYTKGIVIKQASWLLTDEELAMRDLKTAIDPNPVRKD